MDSLLQMGIMFTLTYNYTSDYGDGTLSGNSYDDEASLMWKGIMSKYKGTLGSCKEHSSIEQSVSSGYFC